MSDSKRIFVPQMSLNSFISENKYLKAENEEMRKLIRDMWHQSCTYDTTCEGCPRYVKHWDGTEECEFETRIIKLGIEVGYEW